MFATLLFWPLLVAPTMQEPASRPQQPTHVPTPIHWHQDLAEAQAASKKDGRPVLAYFTFDT